MDESCFKVASELTCNKIKVSVKSNLEKNYEYAYYLLKDDRRISTKWYSCKSAVEFDLKDCGRYKVICFIKDKEDKTIISTGEYSFSPYTTKTKIQRKFPVSIFGSCVTRDLFEFTENDFMILKSYIARQSIISAVSESIECKKQDIKLESNFQREMVFHDFCKDSFTILGRDRSDFVIIDLIDERFSLIRYKGSFVTASTYLINSKLLDNSVLYKVEKGKDNKYYLEDNDIDKYLEDFCLKMLTQYEPFQIILHKAFLLDKYIDINGKLCDFGRNYIVNNKKTNERLCYMYNYLETYMKCGLVIDCCREYYASEKHKWGLAPMHYCNEYYNEVLLRLKSYMNQ